MHLSPSHRVQAMAGVCTAVVSPTLRTAGPCVANVRGDSGVLPLGYGAVRADATSVARIAGAVTAQAGDSAFRTGSVRPGPEVRCARCGPAVRAGRVRDRRCHAARHVHMVRRSLLWTIVLVVNWGGIHRPPGLPAVGLQVRLLKWWACTFSSRVLRLIRSERRLPVCARCRGTSF